MTFLEKYELLKKSVPVPAVSKSSDTVDCEYSDHIYYSSKNCYYCFDSGELTDSIYTVGWGSNKLIDCYLTIYSEKCYQCSDSHNCNNCTYLMDCNNCTDCHFSAFLNSCSDCFGCVALTHKKYCIFNKQYSKEEYLKKVEELKKEKPEKIMEQMFELKLTIPYPSSEQNNNENCPYGDYIYYSKNSYWCFHAYYTENSGFIFNSGTMNNCWDVYFSAGNPDRGTLSVGNYQLLHTYDSYYCAFLIESYNCTNSYYGAFLNNCSNCFGCVGLTNKKYCILNNQLTKNQYEKAVIEIKDELGWKI